MKQLNLKSILDRDATRKIVEELKITFLKHGNLKMSKYPERNLTKQSSYDITDKVHLKVFPS